MNIDKYLLAVKFENIAISHLDNTFHFEIPYVTLGTYHCHDIVYATYVMDDKVKIKSKYYDCNHTFWLVESAGESEIR